MLLLALHHHNTTLTSCIYFADGYLALLRKKFTIKKRLQQQASIDRAGLLTAGCSMYKVPQATVLSKDVYWYVYISPSDLDDIIILLLPHLFSRPLVPPSLIALDAIALLPLLNNHSNIRQFILEKVRSPCSSSSLQQGQ